MKETNTHHPVFIVSSEMWSEPEIITMDAEAVRLWLLAGSWSAYQGTGGWIPESVLLRLPPTSVEDTRKLAQKITDAGLWIEYPADGDEPLQWQIAKDYGVARGLDLGTAANV